MDDLDDNQVDNDDDDNDDDDDNVDDNFEDEDSFIEENSLNESTHSNGGNAGLGSKTKKTSKKHGKKSKQSHNGFSLGNGIDSSSPMSNSLLQINNINNRYLGGHSNIYGHHHHHSGSGSSKPARIRTVLNEKQLHMLRACYNANPRPDALMKEHLVEMTGLNPRVIRVWFQNKRCKDKKKNMLVRPEHSVQLPPLHPASSSPFSHSHMANNNNNLIANHQHNTMFDNCY